MLQYALLLSLPCLYEGIKPVVLVPGALGSQLEAKLNKQESSNFYCSTQSNWFLIWLSLEFFLGPGLNCWADNFRMNFTNGEFKDIDGVQIRAKYFGELDGVKFIDNFSMFGYYNALSQQILAVEGAEEGLNVRAAPFDFRYAPPSKRSERYFVKLKYLIEEMYETNDGQPVVIVAHSLGCLMMSTFFNRMSEEWKSKYVDSFMSIAGVYAGALKLVKTMVSHGVVDDVPDFISNRFVHRSVARTIMGNYFMLPRQPYWDKEVLLSTPNKNYTVRDYAELFTDLGHPKGGAKWETVQNSSSVAEHGVKTFCFNGKGLDTAAAYYYNDQKNFPDQIPKEVQGKGDGTVPVRSLAVCHDWASTDQVFEYETEEAEHLNILSHPDVMGKIVEYLSTGSIGNMT